MVPVLELIEPDEHPSTWREVSDQNGEGPTPYCFTEGMKTKINIMMERNQMKGCQKKKVNMQVRLFGYIRETKVTLELLKDDKTDPTF